MRAAPVPVRMPCRALGLMPPPSNSPASCSSRLKRTAVRPCFGAGPRTRGFCASLGEFCTPTVFGSTNCLRFWVPGFRCHNASCRPFGCVLTPPAMGHRPDPLRAPRICGIAYAHTTRARDPLAQKTVTLPVAGRCRENIRPDPAPTVFSRVAGGGGIPRAFSPAKLPDVTGRASLTRPTANLRNSLRAGLTGGGR